MPSKRTKERSVWVMIVGTFSLLLALLLSISYLRSYPTFWGKALFLTVILSFMAFILAMVGHAIYEKRDLYRKMF